MIKRWGFKAGEFAVITCLVIVGFGIFNAHYFDIGKTLDSNMSASNLYYNEFSKIPDKAIFMPNYAWEWEAIYKYNADYDKHIYPICIDILPSKLYQEQLQKDGIILVVGNNTNSSLFSSAMAKSIVELNDNVWTTVSTEPSTFGSKVIEANHDTSVIVTLDEARMIETATNPQIKWMPYAPYDIITTSIMVEKWNYVLKSNKNVLFAAFCVLVVLFIYRVFLKSVIGRKKDKEVK